MASMRTSTDDCGLVVGSLRTDVAEAESMRPRDGRAMHHQAGRSPGNRGSADTDTGRRHNDVVLNLDVDAVRHVVRRHGQPLPALSDNTEAIPRSIREMVCVVQVEPYELAGEFLGALAVSAQALQPVGVSTVIRHRRRSSLIRCCGSTDPRLRSVPGDRGRARGSGWSSSRHLVLFPRCSRGVPPDGWDSE